MVYDKNGDPVNEKSAAAGAKKEKKTKDLQKLVGVKDEKVAKKVKKLGAEKNKKTTKYLKKILAKDDKNAKELVKLVTKKRPKKLAGQKKKDNTSKKSDDQIRKLIYKIQVNMRKQSALEKRTDQLVIALTKKVSGGKKPRQLKGSMLSKILLILIYYTR